MRKPVRSDTLTINAKPEEFAKWLRARLTSMLPEMQSKVGFEVKVHEYRKFDGGLWIGAVRADDVTDVLMEFQISPEKKRRSRDGNQ